MLPSGDLVARARAAGRRRLLIHRLGNAAAGVTAATLFAAGVTSFGPEWWQATPDSRPGATATKPADADAVTGLEEPWAGLADADTVGWCTLKSDGTYKVIAAAARGAGITFVTSDQPLDDPGPDGPAIP